MSIHPRFQQRRQDYLDALYLLDGRDNPTHPRHATYTALFTEHVQALVERDMREVLAAINPAS